MDREPVGALPREVHMPTLIQLRLGQVAPEANGQVRREFDAASLQCLAESLKRSGVREPIIVRPDGEAGKYRLVAGERRWRAAQLAGLAEIPALVDDRLAEPKARLLAQAEENLQREDLNVVEEAAVLVRLMESLSLDAGKAGELIGRSYQKARRLLQIHEAPEAVKEAIVRGRIDARAALELVRIHNRLLRRGGPDAQRRAAAEVEAVLDRVMKEGWTIRRLEAHAKEVAEGSRKEASRAAAPPTASPGSPRPPGKAPEVASLAIPLPAVSSEKASAQGTPWCVLPAGMLQLDTGRIVRGEFTGSEYSALIAMLEDLLIATRRAPRAQAGVVSPRGERPGAR
jgi:ParB family chromosome partitioning protein